MEQYQKRIGKRMCLLSLAALFAAGLGVFDVFFAPDKMKEAEAFDFQCGFTTALGIFAVIILIYYGRIRRNEKELQKQYNKENDERMKMIRAKAGLPMVLILSVIMIVAGIVIGYSNSMIFYTLVTAGMCQMGAAGIVKLIYMRMI